MKEKSLKLVIFSDLHYLDNNHKEMYNRKLTNLSLTLLEKMIYEINYNICPNACVFLGDFIEDTNDYDNDINNLKYIYNEFNSIKVPFYAVLGNHDLCSINSRKEVENIMRCNSFTFSINIDGYHLIFLGLDVINHLGKLKDGIKKRNLYQIMI